MIIIAPNFSIKKKILKTTHALWNVSGLTSESSSILFTENPQSLEEGGHRVGF